MILIAVLIYFKSYKKSELVCVKEEIKDEFMLYETDIIKFKGKKFVNSNFQEEVVFYSDYLDLKDSILEESKNQFSGTGVSYKTEEIENGFIISTNLDKEQFSSIQKIDNSNYNKESIKKIMTDKGYTCQ